MFKKILAPVQAWLLSQGKCVGCGTALDSGKREKRKDGTEKITCKCSRIFIFDPKTKRYHRALFDEV